MSSKNPDIIELMVDWGHTQPGIVANLYHYVRHEDEVKIAQFLSGEGYNEYKRVGCWLASVVMDPDGLRIWGPDSYGDAGGLSLGPNGETVHGRYVYWLKPVRPEFFESLRKVLFRFHRRSV